MASTTTGRRRRVTMIKLLNGEGEKDAPLRMYHCGVVAPLCTSWTHRNPSKRFYGCRHNQYGRGCGFFKWYEDEMGDRAKKVIKELLAHVEKLNDANVWLRRRDEEGVTGYIEDDIATIYANMRKNEKRLKLAFFALLMTWIFFVVLFCCIK